VLFNTFTFAVFFTLVCSIYWLNKNSYKRQNIILFAASYIFYGWWDARFLTLLVLSTFLDYTASILIDRKKLDFDEKAKSYAFLLAAVFLFVGLQQTDFSSHWPFLVKPQKAPDALFGWWLCAATAGFLVIFEFIQKLSLRYPQVAWDKFYLAWSVALNLVILGVFKYFNFFADSFIALWSWVFAAPPTEMTFRIVLPVGVSFFIFQTISHTVDVYRKKITADFSLVELATYVAFFPQLVAGPIERGAHLLPQFQKPRTVSSDEKKEALWLIAWGLYKKVVVADNVARIVNHAFQPYDKLIHLDVPHDGLRCLVAVYAFAIQIYCDFSGYTDIARGTARLLGFDIMLNFNLPYFATNPSDFWRRWHISLSSWLRDYLYIPLGGNRNGTLATYRNVMITMLLGGLWHGAAWNFVYWGVYHGLLLVAYNLLNERSADIQLSFASLMKGLLMFHLVCVGWLLFRAQNMTTVYVFLQAIFTSFKSSPEALAAIKDLIFYSWFLVGFQFVQAFSGNLNLTKNAQWFVRLNIWIFIITSIFSLSRGKAQEFIYFAF
jgi:alginate O-acetyltransferase complex protein AlgI